MNSRLCLSTGGSGPWKQHGSLLYYAAPRSIFSLSLSYAKWIPAPTDHSHSPSSVFIAGAWETAGSAVLDWKISLHNILSSLHKVPHQQVDN